MKHLPSRGDIVFKLGNTPVDMLKNTGYTVEKTDRVYVNLAGLRHYVHISQLQTAEEYVERTVTDCLPVSGWEESKETVEHTGGSSSYYDITLDDKTVRCNDIIEELNMNYAQATIFKAIWRICASKLGRKKKGNNTVYDAEKIKFFAERVLIQERVINA